MENSTGKPNILLIFTDQQTWNTLGVYGHPVVKTPNLDRVAARGAAFRNAFCAQPVCTPSRGSLMTGTYPHTHGSIDNNYILTEDIPTLAEILKPHGYNCGYIGKWHIGREVHPQRGFDEFWRSTEAHYASLEDREQGWYSSYHHFLASNGFVPAGEEKKPFAFPSFSRYEAARMPERFSKPAYEAQQAEEFFLRHHEEPFLLTINFLEPHDPYFGPFDDMYDPGQIELPANYDAIEDPLYPDHIKRRIHNFSETFYEDVKTKDQKALKGLIARYLGNVSLVDKYVGKILESLNSFGLAENTIIVYTSDHGDMLGSHHLVEKRVMFEEALKVPFLIHHPGMDFSASMYDDLTSNVDVVPTLLDMAGVPKPAHIQGKSLLPVLEGSGAGQDAVFAEWHPRKRKPNSPTNNILIDYDAPATRTIRTAEWKLNVNIGDRWELYDIARDPTETRNLIDEPESVPVIEDLLSRVKDWQKRTNDSLPLPEKYLAG